MAVTLTGANLDFALGGKERWTAGGTHTAVKRPIAGGQGGRDRRGTTMQEEGIEEAPQAPELDAAAASDSAQGATVPTPEGQRELPAGGAPPTAPQRGTASGANGAKGQPKEKEQEWTAHSQAKGKGGKGERSRGKGAENAFGEENDVFAVIHANQKLTLSLARQMREMKYASPAFLLHGPEAPRIPSHMKRGKVPRGEYSRRREGARTHGLGAATPALRWRSSTRHSETCSRTETTSLRWNRLQHLSS